MNLGGTVHINRTGCCILLGVLVIFLIYMFSNRSAELSPFDEPKLNLRKLLAVAIKAAEDGGKEVVASKDHLTIESKGKTNEGANDSVTTADLKSHCVMVGRLKRSFPALAVVSEEEQTVCDKAPNAELEGSDHLDNDLNDEWINEKDVKVWIDPLDATQEYTEKLYQYVTTMVCVSVKGKPIIGVIHKPFSLETAWAWVEKARSANILQTKPQPKHDILKFIVSRSHTGPAKEVIKKKFRNQKIEIISAGGAGYKVLEVANGNVDVYIHTTAIKKWDICAGNAILTHLGGRMTTKYNVVIDYADSENPVNEDGIVATLQDHDIYLHKL